VPLVDSDVEIRTASVHDIARIAAALGQAFVDDPVMVWAIPERDRRRSVLPGFFTVFTAAYQRHGHVYRTADGAAAALWAPPGVAAVGDDEGEEFGAALGEICGADAARMFAISALLDEHHPHEPVWYLNFIGVEPAGQGRGLGSAMLEHVLVRADRDGASAYLDATSARNRALYERHGFVATGELAVPDGPSFWPMRRAPQPR
jgi:ribosomal protein S18 acetylase RimI-like enzyme